MRHNFLLLAFLSLLSCSQVKLMRMIAKSPSPTSTYQAIEGNKYEKDAHYLGALIRHSYPRLADKISPAAYDSALAELLLRCKTVPDERAFNLELQRFLAKLKDGHTKATLVRYWDKGEDRYSVRFFNEGGRFVLSNIHRSVDSSLIGSRIKYVNGVSIETVVSRIRQLESSENEHFALFRFNGKEQFPAYWQALGLVKNTQEPLVLGIERPDGQQVQATVRPSPVLQFYKEKYAASQYPFTNRQNDGFSYKILEPEKIAYLQMNTCLDYVAYKSEIKNYTNVLTKPIALAFLKKRSKNARNFGLVLQSMFREIHEKNIQTLVLDLRNNTGGDERLGKQLIWYLTERKDLRGFQDYYQISNMLRKVAKVDYHKYDRLHRDLYGRPLPTDTLINISAALLKNPAYFDDLEKEGSPFLIDRSLPKFKGKVYVLIGPKTFSAAQYLATSLKDNDLATIVGLPLGNQPSSQTGASMLKLPYTKTLVSLSFLYGERPDRSKNEEDSLYPDVRVERTFYGVRAGRDEAFEWVREHVR
jgi:hypothetical protein